MKNLIKLKAVFTICSIFFIQTIFCQWQLADTTIQSARDVDFPHPNAAYLTTDMGIMFKSTDGGASWFELHSFGVFSSLRNPQFINKDTGFVFAHPGLQRTFDGGQTWTVVSQMGLSKYSSISINSQAIFISFINYADSTVYLKKSLDYGITFATILQFFDSFSDPFAISFINDLEGYAVNPNEPQEVYKTINGGVSFDTIQVTSGPIHLERRFEFKDFENGYVFGAWGPLANPSRTWTHSSSYFQIDLDGFGVLPIFDMELHRTSRIFAASLYGKIFSSLNNGQFWTEHETPVDQPVTSISFSDEMNGIAVSEDQIIYTKNGDVLSYDAIEKSSIINLFPNPVKSLLYIQSSNVNINAVYFINMSGEVVYEENANPVFGIDIKNLAAGVYLLKISTDTETVFRKVIIE